MRRCSHRHEGSRGAGRAHGSAPCCHGVADKLPDALWDLPCHLLGQLRPHLLHPIGNNPPLLLLLLWLVGCCCCRDCRKLLLQPIVDTPDLLLLWGCCCCCRDCRKLLLRQPILGPTRPRLLGRSCRDCRNLLLQPILDASHLRLLLQRVCLDGCGSHSCRCLQPALLPVMCCGGSGLGCWGSWLGR